MNTAHETRDVVVVLLESGAGAGDGPEVGAWFCAWAALQTSVQIRRHRVREAQAMVRELH